MMKAGVGYSGTLGVFAGLLLLSSWLVSNHYPPWVAAHSELMAALAACVLFAAAMSSAKRERLRLPASGCFLVTVAAIPFAQGITGHVFFFGDGWIATLFLLGTAVAVVSAFRLTDHKSTGVSLGLAQLLVAGAVVSSVVAVLQRFEVDAGAFALHLVAVSSGGRPSANLAQPNQLASLLLLGLCSVWFLFEVGKLKLGWAMAAAVWLTVTLGMTQSRTPILFFTVLLVAHWLAAQRAGVRLGVKAPVALAVLWGSSFMAWPVVTQLALLQRSGTLTERVNGLGRAEIWRSLWDAAWLRPWTGFGWNQVSVAQLAVAADHPRTEYVEHSHNLLLDLLLWNGVPLGLLIIGIGSLWLWRRMRDVRHPQGLFGLLVVGLLLTHAMVEFPLDYLYFLVPFGVAIGLVEASRPNPVPALSVPVAVGWGMVVAFFGVTAWTAADYWRVEDAYREMRFTVARIGRPMVTEPPPLLATQFTQLAAFHRFSLFTPHPGMSPQEVDWMRKVAHRFAYAPSLYRYALAQAWSGDVEGAKLTLRQMRQLHGERPHDAAQRELREMVQGEHPELRGLLLAP